MVASLTWCFLAASATLVRSASRSTATICSSVNRLFLMGSSQDGIHLPRNQWSEETGQVTLKAACEMLQHVMHPTTFVEQCPRQPKQELAFVRLQLPSKRAPRHLVQRLSKSCR